MAEAEATLPAADIGRALRRELGILTEEEAAAALGRDVKTLRAWRYDRCGPRYVKAGSAVIYRREAILEWLKRSEQETE
jgi:hypothetical protein